MDDKRTTPQESITPDFEKRSDGTKIGSPEGAAEKLRKSEANATKGNGGGEGRIGGGLYRGNASRGGDIKYRPSDKSKVAGKGKGFFKKTAPLMVGLGVVLIALVALSMGPTLAIGTIKENLIRSLGFLDTAAILEEQAEFVTSEKMANGEMPSGYSSDLAAAGIEVGQVTLAGKFVRTDTYIANIDELDVVAAEGEYQVHGGDGELVVRFNDEIITADNFVAAVESSPEMYAAYSEALDISSRYYYSDAVNDVYNNMGLSRGSFNGWKATGNSEADEESFMEILTASLDKESNRNLSGKYRSWHADCTGWARVPVGDSIVTICVERTWFGDQVTWECTGGGSSWNCNYERIPEGEDGSGEPITEKTTITGEPEDVAKQIVDYVSKNSRIEYVDESECSPLYETFDAGYGYTGVYVNSNECKILYTAEENAAQILNTVISADEPYRAASAFMSVMEAIERAQIDGDGPVNEMMNILSQGNEITYVDMNTGETVTEKKPVLETYNFEVAVGDGVFSKTEANNSARDRLLHVSGASSPGSIEHMVMSTDGKKKSGDGAEMKNNEHSTVSATNAPASLGGGARPADAMRIAMAEKNSELLQTPFGGNRILEGGSLVSNTINQQVIGAMPSDAAQVATYKQEVNTVLARRAAADQATKSPFDISSPYTFMGNLVRKVAKVGISNYTSGDNALIGVAKGLAKLAGNSFIRLSASTMADGNDDSFTSVVGDFCDTTATVVDSCDLYGSAHNTVSIEHMDWTQSEWESVVSESEMEDFINQAMKRDTNVGTRSYEVCRAAASADSESTSSGGILEKVKGFFKKIVSAIKKVIIVETDASDLQKGCNGELVAKQVDDEAVEEVEGAVQDDIATGKAFVLRGGVDDDTAKKSGYALHAMVSSMLDESEAGETASTHGLIMYSPK